MLVKPDKITKIKEGRATYLVVQTSNVSIKVRYTRELWPSVKAMIKDFEKGYHAC